MKHLPLFIFMAAIMAGCSGSPIQPTTMPALANTPAATTEQLPSLSEPTPTPAPRAATASCPNTTGRRAGVLSLLIWKNGKPYPGIPTRLVVPSSLPFPCERTAITDAEGMVYYDVILDERYSIVVTHPTRQPLTAGPWLVDAVDSPWRMGFWGADALRMTITFDRD